MDVVPTGLAASSQVITVAIDEHDTTITTTRVIAIDRADGTQHGIYLDTIRTSGLLLVQGASSVLVYDASDLLDAEVVGGGVAFAAPAVPLGHQLVPVFDGTDYQLFWLDADGDVETRGLDESASFVGAARRLWFATTAGASLVLVAHPLDVGRVVVELVENGATVHVAFVTSQSIEHVDVALAPGCATPYIGSAVLVDPVTAAPSLRVLGCATATSIAPGGGAAVVVALDRTIDELVAASSDAIVVRSGTSYARLDAAYVAASFVPPTEPSCPPLGTCAPTRLWTSDGAAWLELVRGANDVHLESFDGQHPAVAQPALDVDQHGTHCEATSSGEDT